MLSKKKVVLALTFLVLVIPFSGCNNNILNSKKTDKVKNKKIIAEQQKSIVTKASNSIILSMNHPATINPILNKDGDVEDIFKLSYLGLIAYNNKLQVIPSIAKDWSYDKSEKTISVNINTNAKWSNGNDITAYDVEYTTNKIIASQNSSPYYSLLSNLDSCFVNPDDSKQIIFKLKAWDTSFINNLFFPIINKEFYSTKGIYCATPSPANGPYKISAYDGTKELDLVSNDKYMGYMPNVAKIQVYVLPDENTKTNMFEEHQIDAVKVMTENAYKDIMFCNDEMVLLGFNFNNSLFNNKLIRKAFAYLINRKELADKVFIGKAIVNEKPFISGSYLQKSPSVIYNYSPQTAEDILKKLNYKDYNNDGFLESRQGNKTVELRTNILVRSGNEKMIQTAAEIRNYLLKLGIKSNLDISDQYNYMEKIKNKKFDLCVLNYKLGYDNDLQQLLGSNNMLGYKNNAIQKLLNDLKISESDNQKKEIYQNIGKIYLEEMPYINIFFKAQDLYINNKVSGEIKPNVYQPYGELYKWELK